jgi:hypothetical protein
MKLIQWATGLLKDEKGTPSSKRFIGIISGSNIMYNFVCKSIYRGTHSTITSFN